METEIPYDRAATPVKSVAILTPDFPKYPMAALASSLGGSFGLIGLLVDAGMNEARQDRMIDLLQKQNFDAQAIFLDRLETGLKAQGYEVVRFAVARDTSHKFLPTYPPQGEVKTDAYLDIIVGAYGYYASGIADSTPYRPAFSARARLVRAKDASVLMQDTVVYNPLGRVEHFVSIAPDPAAQYVHYDQLLADPVKAAGYLRTAEEKSADALAGLLH